MNKRIYLLTPSLKEAEKIQDEFLLKRICIHHIHALAKEGQPMGSLPEATLLQRYDILHSLWLGMWGGALVGLIVGLVVFTLLNIPLGGWVVLTVVIGASVSAWCASMVGIIMPNIHLKRFRKAIAHGQYLLLVDVPQDRVEEMQDMLKKYPMTYFKGVDPNVHASFQ